VPVLMEPTPFVARATAVAAAVTTSSTVKAKAEDSVMRIAIVYCGSSDVMVTFEGVSQQDVRGAATPCCTSPPPC